MSITTNTLLVKGDAARIHWLAHTSYCWNRIVVQMSDTSGLFLMHQVSDSRSEHANLSNDKLTNAIYLHLLDS